jgi:hypothetical protein
MADLGRASAFYRYAGVDDFVAVAASLYFPLIFLAAILLESHADRRVLFRQRRSNHPPGQRRRRRSMKA